jgi:predicted DNA-binding transcriptional regulator AlpA
MHQPQQVAEDDVERLLDVKQVSERLGVSEKTVWVMSADGRFIPPLALGRLRKWRVAEFNRWVQRQAKRRKVDA